VQHNGVPLSQRTGASGAWNGKVLKYNKIKILPEKSILESDIQTFTPHILRREFPALPHFARN